MAYRELGCILSLLAQGLVLVLLDHLLDHFQLQEPSWGWVAAASLASASFLGQPFGDGLAGADPVPAFYRP